MAVPVNDGAALEARQLEVWRKFLKKFAEQERLLGQTAGAIVLGEKVAQFIAENGGATGLQAHNGNIGVNEWRQGIQDFQQQVLGAAEHSEVVKGAPATQTAGRKQDLIACRLQNLDSGDCGIRQEIVVKGVWPEEDWRAAWVSCLVGSKPAFERVRRKCRQPPFLRHAHDGFGDIAQEWQLCREIRQSWSHGCKARPKIDVPKGICTSGTTAPVVVVGQELCLVGCDVNSDRTIALASFA